MLWLNAYSPALTAVATVGILLATIVYAVITVGLWRATKRQADITRVMFEAGNRPWVSVTLGEPRLDPNLVMFVLTLQNGGTVPADITRWEMRPSVVDGNGHEQPLVLRVKDTPEGMSLSPDVPEQIRLGFERGGHVNSPYRLWVTIHYRGIAGRTYWTTVNAALDGTTWHMQPTTRGNRRDD